MVAATLKFDTLGRCLADIQNEVNLVLCGITNGNFMLGNISPEQAGAEKKR